LGTNRGWQELYDSWHLAKTMIDPFLSLALSVQSNRGVYALLLGSGISRAAQIPTGWEIVEDLIRKIARLREQECGADPGAWYTETFGAAPNYSDLLADVAKAPAERAQLLREYFEPTPEERERDLKVPTKAHKAIARLVSKGYLRVIVTTNFDRLMEAALAAEGITPTVLSTPDAIQGGLPIVHTPCCVVKVHGDYMDSRISNTDAELAAYDQRTDQLLDRIFDEFGLIVCGWSAQWDIALRAALERCTTRRFTTFWAAHGEPTPEAKRLIDLRRAEVIPIGSADDFFHQLAEKVESLEQLSSPHPLSAKVAAATVKRYLVDERRRIDLHDLVMQETENTLVSISPSHFPVQAAFSLEALGGRLKRYEARTEILRAIVTTGCYWGSKEQTELWIAGDVRWNNLRLYPALLLLYSGGLAAVAAAKYATFFALLTEPILRAPSREYALLDRVNASGRDVVDWSVMKQLPGLERHLTPTCDHLFQILREPLREFLPDDAAYEQRFDRFEYLLALVYADLSNDEWGPIGCFIWRDGRLNGEDRVAGRIKKEANAAGEDWPPLKAGLFKGSIDRFNEVQVRFDEFGGLRRNGAFGESRAGHKVAARVRGQGAGPSSIAPTAC
jgi:hypothetical protein